VALPGNGPWYSNYFWVPIVGPLIGGVIGVFVYEFFIKNVLIARGVVESEP
jgi:glycerol uptake facilitator protein